MSEAKASAPAATPVVAGPMPEVKNRRALTGDEASDMLDPDTLKAGFRYRWVQERPSNVVRKRSQGFTFVNRSEGIRTLYEQDDNAGDGFIRHGDRILMKEPIKANEARRRGNLRTSEARLKSSDAKVREMAARAGVKLSEGDEEK